MAENFVSITGNTTREGELRFTAAGKAVTNLGVAVNRRTFNKTTNDYDESTSFFEVTCWDSLAENVAQLAKGTRVTVEGRLEQQTWETDEGEKRSKVIIVADEVATSMRWATVTITRNEKGAPSSVTPGATSAAIADFVNGLLPPDEPF